MEFQCTPELFINDVIRILQINKNCQVVTTKTSETQDKCPPP